MNKPKFTPGPWRAHHNSYIGWLIIDQHDMPILSEAKPKHELSANIEVSKAAPEMYDLLHRIATHKGDDLGLFAHEAAQIVKEIDNNQ